MGRFIWDFGGNVLIIKLFKLFKLLGVYPFIWTDRTVKAAVQIKFGATTYIS